MHNGRSEVCTFVGVQVSHMGYGTSTGCRLQAAGCRLQAAGCRLQADAQDSTDVGT